MERPKILVLGAGLVGAEIARCLSEAADVTVMDRNVEALAAISLKAPKHGKLETINADFLDDANEVAKIASHHNVVVGAIEPSIAYGVLMRVARARTPIVDISFYEQSPLSLDKIAEYYGIPIVVDCGVMPGLGGMLLGREMKKMNVEKFVCQCGGLPANPEPPWFYKAPFSVRSVLDLYTRKALIVADGKTLEVDHPLKNLTEVLLPEYPELGTLIGIKSDGLRTLLTTTTVPNMMDQSLRYPAHMRLVQDFIKSGFLSEEPVSVKTCDGNYVDVVPRIFSERILADAWKLGEDEDEFTVFVVRIEGVSGDKKTHITYHSLVRRDPVTLATSMSRMTGYPCAAVALLLARGDITKAGVITPEEIGGNDKHMDFVLDFMKERGISLTKTIS